MRRHKIFLIWVIAVMLSFCTTIKAEELTLSTLAPERLWEPGDDPDDITNTNSGNVGIGTTAPSNLLHLYKNGTEGDPLRLHLQKGNTNSFYATEWGYATGEGAVMLGQNAYWNNAGVVERADTGDPAWLMTMHSDPQDSYNIIRVAADGTANTFLRIQPSGNVGIGTTSPGARLHVAGGDILLDNTKALRIKGTDGSQTQAVALDSGNRLHFSNWSPSGGRTIFFDTLNAGNISMTILGGSGNVGIGTTDPQSRLDVNGVICAGPQNASSGEGGELVLQGANTLNNWHLDNKDGYFRMHHDLVPYFLVSPLGNVGIGTTNPGSYKLNVNGSAAKPGGGTWSDSCDVRLKKNIKQIEHPLDRITKLRGVEFEWDELERAKLLPGAQLGMIAQEVEGVFPQWVGTDANGYKDLTFRGFEALAVEAIKELKVENDALKKRIEALEAKQKQL